MRKLVSLSLVLVIAAVCNGCIPQLVKVKPRLKVQDDAVTKSVLRDYMKSHPSPSVVLRVPVTSGNVAQAVQAENEKLSGAYGVIERQLVKAGYTVRDRALLTTLMASNATPTYKEIRDRIETDLIIEISRFEPADMSSRDYVVWNAKKNMDGPPRSMTYGAFTMSGATIEARVVIVETGAIGGIYSKTVPPCEPCYFSYDQTNALIYATDDLGRKFEGWPSAHGIDYKYAAQQFADYLIGQLK